MMGNIHFALMERNSQSALGITSLAIAIINIPFISILFLVAAFDSSGPNSAATMILGFLIIGSLFFDLVAIGLGVAGILQKTRNRIYAIIGTVLASSAFVITFSVIALGLTQKT